MGRKRGSNFQKKDVKNSKTSSRYSTNDMDDEIDTFHRQRNIIPLDINDDAEESDEDQELPVFDVKDVDEDEDEDDDDDDDGDEDDNEDDDVAKNKDNPPMKMGTRRKKVEEEPSHSLSEDDGRCSENEGVEAQADDSSRYEQARDQRIKENMDRMHKLGLLDLSLKLKPPKKNKNPLPKKKKTSIELSHSRQRRSSRIMCLTPINYSEKSLPNSASKDNDELEIFIPEGTNPEGYTEEQEKLLGDCETAWELYVDGYDENGKRIYDPIKGETCHQCRQKTVGQHTQCNKCELLQGQFCGDCLYMRYGENVTEANYNPNWTCPPCRDICNCSRCRRAKGWMPTGNVYSKVSKLGFKSVAHYLIKARHSELEGTDAENIVVEEISDTSANTTLIRPTRTRASLRT